MALEQGEGRNQGLFHERFDGSRAQRCRIPQLRQPSVSRGKVRTTTDNTSRSTTEKSRVTSTMRCDRWQPTVAANRRAAGMTPLRKLDTLGQMNKNRACPGTRQQQQRMSQRLPDQATIRQSEEREKNEFRNENHLSNNLDREKLIDSNENVIQVKMNWQEKMLQFDNMKTELEVRQKALIELYSSLKDTHSIMSTIGQPATMPPAEELRIMNVAKMTPSQLLQLCSGSVKADDSYAGKVKSNIDMNKMFDIPTKLVAVCEQTLSKRKEIIDWFESLKREEKGISLHKLSKKINEFNAENEMLYSSLQTVKADFLKEINEIVDHLRKGVNETIALQLRTEELTYEMSELNSLNADLRKQLHAAENTKSQSNRHRLEELEKELKEEKCKKMVIRDRLSRAEGQVKIGNERAAQLEAALEQSRAQNWTLERTVQQLHDQNQKLQSEFDKELHKMTESIREHTAQLEEIAEAREVLQNEKLALERRLQELSMSYDSTLDSMQQETKTTAMSLMETEKTLNEEKAQRQALQAKVDKLSSQLMETEIRYKDVLCQLQEKEQKSTEAEEKKKSALEEVTILKSELEGARQDLEIAHLEVEDYRQRLLRQGETIREIESNFKETISLEKNLRNELTHKDDYIKDLVHKQSILEQQLQEGEQKMETYENQLTSLKNQITQLKEDFGEFDTLNELNEMINEQRQKLIDVTRQNGELEEALRKKEMELENNMEHMAEQETLLETREGLIEMMRKKEKEQMDMVKMLQDNLEKRAQSEDEINQQLSVKCTEVEALTANLETRKQQILQYEKIILTFEDQLRTTNRQWKEDQEKLKSLENSLLKFQSLNAESRHNESPVDNLDNLIKILEEELGTSFEPDRKKHFGDRHKRDKHNKYERQDGDNSIYSAEHEKMPTKIVMGNFVKKTYVTSKSDDQYNGDKLDRKKAITCIDAQNWGSSAEPGLNHAYAIASAPQPHELLLPYNRGMPLPKSKECLSRNLQFLMSNHRDEKKCKMYKLAGHRL